VGRLVTLSLTAGSAREAEEAATVMCRQLLANPVTEDFDVRVLEVAG
jgi:phosphoribosylformylglycinamidine (FGAM) synthase PurS component